MERRANERYRIWFPMTVVTDGGEEGTAITYDVSSTGLSMACPGSVAVGQHVELRFRMAADDAEERRIGAFIVRLEERLDETGPWRFRMAVQFDDAHPELEGALEAQGEDE